MFQRLCATSKDEEEGQAATQSTTFSIPQWTDLLIGGPNVTKQGHF